MRQKVSQMLRKLANWVDGSTSKRKNLFRDVKNVVNDSFLNSNVQISNLLETLCPSYNHPYKKREKFGDKQNTVEQLVSRGLMPKKILDLNNIDD